MASEFESSSSDRKSGVTGRIKEDGKQRIDATKRSAADQIEQVANVISRAGSDLNDGQPRLANYANRAADRVSSLANRLREASIEDLLEDTRTLARRNPGLFILGGIALGIVVSRFLKASSSNLESSELDYDYGTETYTGESAAATLAGRDDTSTTYGAGSTSFSGQDTIDIEATRGTSSNRGSQGTSRTTGG
jgi:hypothetical protein